MAQEQQIDILNTADVVTNVEQSILSPLLELFVEMDHQYRDDEVYVKQYGELGRELTLEAVPPNASAQGPKAIFGDWEEAGVVSISTYGSGFAYLRL